VQLRFDRYKGAELNKVTIKRDIDDLVLGKSGLVDYFTLSKEVPLAVKELFIEENGMRPEVKKVKA
jgi:hypothetical protein